MGLSVFRISDGLIQEVRSFWDPRMRREIIAHLADNRGEDLNEIARAAVRVLEAEASAKAAG